MSQPVMDLTRALEHSEWHTLESSEVLRRLGTEWSLGLTLSEVDRRHETFGANRFPVALPDPWWRAPLRQFAQPLVLVLLLAGLMTLAFKDWVDAGVIFGVVLVNAVIGWVQEGRAEASLRALATSVASVALVWREGQLQRVAVADLVPGDRVQLAAGDRVPADLRMIDVSELRIDESVLTGESLPVSKQIAAVAQDAFVAERHCMAYAGCPVLVGSGWGVVVAIGAVTEYGKIAAAMQGTVAMTTPLSRYLEIFSRRMLWVILVLAGMTFVIGVLRGETAYSMFIAAVALAIGAIPEGLPAAVTVTLAIGVSRMAARRAVVRRMPAVEALGSATIICSDKTGTLTENQMTVREIVVGRQVFTVTGNGYALSGEILLGSTPATTSDALRGLLVAGVLCNDAALHRQGKSGAHIGIVGDPTEAALLVLARKAGFDEISLRHATPRRAVQPFFSEARLMATLDMTETGALIHAKGALESIEAGCRYFLNEQGVRIELDGGARAAIYQHAVRMAEAGLRVLALARRELQAGEHGPLWAAGQSNGVLLGLVGMVDPPRVAAAHAVKICLQAGVSVRMITGDDPVTALAIARQLGLVSADARPADVVLTGREMGALSDAALAERVVRTPVFARIEPTQKLQLVEIFQQRGEIVAMTGDGVNDAPALKRADIGVAMGAGGTEVAREAADIVLTDDDFSSIEAAIETGRGVYDNLVKFLTWTLPTNFGEGLVIFAAILAGVALPITPLQILWINMTTAVLLGMPLAFEPVERGVMRRPPRNPRAPLLDPPLISRIVVVSTLMLLAAFGLFMFHRSQGASLEEARTIAMNVFVVIAAFYLFNCRRRYADSGVGGKNPWILRGVLAMVALQLLMTYAPPMQSVFGTAAISLTAWGQIVLCGLCVYGIVRLEQWSWARRGHRENAR